METKLILVEGIPGSGKSTFAGRITDFYMDRGIRAKRYLEGDSHPADLAWQACVPIGRLEEVLAPYESLREEIRKHMHFSEGYAVIAYTKVITENMNFYQDMERYELCNNRAPLDVYRTLHLKRWAAFEKEAHSKEELTIFECAFLQNHISELLHFRLFDKEGLLPYFRELIGTVTSLRPVLVYLSQPNIRETVTRVAKERIWEHGSWINDFIRYFENSPYGKIHGVKGLDGAVRCLEERKACEMEIMRSLPIRTIILENPDYDWETVWNTLKAQLPL